MGRESKDGPAEKEDQRESEDDVASDVDCTKAEAKAKSSTHAAENGGKGQTFRKRRLTLARTDMANDTQAAAAAAASFLSSDDDSNDEEGRNDKIVEAKVSNPPNDTLSLKRAREDEFTYTGSEHEEKRARSLSLASSEIPQRRSSGAVASQPKKGRRQLRRPSRSVAKSMTHMHMNQGFICRIRQRLIAKMGNDVISTAGSPSGSATNDARRPSMLRRGSNDTTESDVFRHDHLPFPRDVVGTFSAHGIEPLYQDSDEEEEKDEESAANEPTVIAKTNQDRGGVAYPYASDWHTALFAAYDGHGEGGELVSQFCMTEIQKRLEKHTLFTSDIGSAFKETFTGVDEALEDEENIEPLYGGTTACVVLMQGRKLTVANAGDSRAVLARRCPMKNEQEDKIKAIDLSIDQNPDSPGEQQRIESCGGYVSPPPDVGLSARVWLDPEFTHIGLAMGRSLGDHAVKSVGVISEPVVSFHQLTDEDEFMIIATDGVWEFITSEEAVQIVAQQFHNGEEAKQGEYSGATAACRDLIETAAKRWAEHEGDYRDDITAVVVKTRELWDMAHT